MKYENINVHDKYDTIIKCDLVYRYYRYNDCYLLVGKDIESDLEIDLTGDLCFNCDYEKENVSVVKHVESLQDVLDFCKEKNIEIASNRLGKNFILVGGGVDTIITPQLSLSCIYDCLVQNKINIYKINNINEYIKLTIHNNQVDLEIKGYNL